MLEDHAKLMTMFVQAREIVGRKKLQKMVYILKKLDYPFQEKYQFHFYGPYSEELTLKIAEMCNLGFIDEKKELKGNYNQYRYQLTKEGESFLAHFQFDLPHMEDCVELLNAESPRFLELVSTILYFNHLDLSQEECIEKVIQVKEKQHYDQHDFHEAFLFIETLKDMALRGKTKTSQFELKSVL